MTRYQVAGGFINLGEYCIAIDSIEAVQFVAQLAEQNAVRLQLPVLQPEAWRLHVRVLLKSGNAIEAAILCMAKTHTASDPVHVRMLSCQAVEEAIRAAIRLEEASST